jgi:hypothetical protein
MKCKTRNYVFFAAAAILVSFLFTCKPLAGGASDGDYDESGGGRITYTDVDYSPDGKSLTLYLDGSTPVRHSRALNYRNAVLGHDLFEVAFISKSGKIARAVWEKGSAAGVSGVERGVNYSAVSVPAGGLSGFADNSGAAIIFVGKKSDRTLLAVGRLVSVNGEPGATIGPNSRFVTFQVDPFKTGVTDNINTTSFTLNGGTDVGLVMIGDKDFPLFNVDAALAGVTVTANYRFEVTTPNAFDPAGGGGYKDGILRGGPMRVADASDYPALPGVPGPRIPRYPIGDGTEQKWKTSLNSSINPLPFVDMYTGVAPVNNSSALPAAPGSTAFSNPAIFTIGPTDTNHGGQPFAFSFEIPVYPLTNIDGRRTIGPSTPDNFMWYIRPGYDSYWLDLDDGIGGSGGAILLGTGQFQKSVSNTLSIRQRPSKTRYNTIQGGFNFSIDDLLVYLNIGGSSQPVPNGDLHFIIGGVKVLPGDNIQSLLASIPSDGRVTVTVEYYGTLGNVVTQPTPSAAPYITNPTPPPAYIFNPDWYPNGGGTPLSTSFDIYYFAPPAGTNFYVPPVGNCYVIHNQEAANAMNANLQNPDMTAPILNRYSYLFVFYDSFDLGGIVVPNGNDYFICIIAAKEDIVVGRTAATSATGSINNNGGNNSYFLGVWPFDEILAVQGMAVNSQSFFINAAGSQENVNKETHAIINPGANNYAGTFIYGTGAGTATLNSSGVTVLDGSLR